MLLARVRQLKEGAERTVSASAHAVEFAVEVFDARSRYQDALKTLRRVDVGNYHDVFLAEVERAYMERRRRITRAEHRTELLTEWIDVLVDSLSAVQARLADGPIPVHELLDEEDLAIMDEERLKAGDVGALGIAESWHA